MGTNYYSVEPNSNTFTPELGLRHIGKSSSGWCFALHLYPKEDINSLAQWERRWLYQDSEVIIVDEYMNMISKDFILEIIKERSAGYTWELLEAQLLANKGSTLQDYLKVNSATKGPNNLFRSKVTGNCIGYGNGPWDYITGNFN